MEIESILDSAISDRRVNNLFIDRKICSYEDRRRPTTDIRNSYFTDRRRPSNSERRKFYDSENR